mgnify:CR=1 FL=1
MEFVQEYQRRRSASSYNDMLAAAAKDEALTREAMLLTRGFEMLWASGHGDIDKLCDEHVEGGGGGGDGAPNAAALLLRAQADPSRMYPGEGTALTLTTQACEKTYRASGDACADVSVSLNAGTGARLLASVSVLKRLRGVAI